MFLEETGGIVASRLRRAESEVRDARSRLTRRRGASPPLNWLNDPEPQRKRGRKPAVESRQRAEGALSIQRELASKGVRLTDRQALGKYHEQRNERASRALGRGAANILNLMSRLRQTY